MISVFSTVADSRGRSNFAYQAYQERMTRSATLHLHNFDRSFHTTSVAREDDAIRKQPQFTRGSLTRCFNSDY